MLQSQTLISGTGRAPGSSSTCSGVTAIPATGSASRFRTRAPADRFVLYPATGPEAIHAFHHPFASARSQNPPAEASPRRRAAA